MKATWRKTLRGLEPASREATDLLTKLKHGQVVMADVKRPRNVQHHRKLFALLNLVVDNQEHYQTAEHLLAALKCATGHADEYPLKDGSGVVMIPKSINFAAMDQTEFEKFYDRALHIIARDVIPGINRADLEREVSEAMNA